MKHKHIDDEDYFEPPKEIKIKKMRIKTPSIDIRKVDRNKIRTAKHEQTTERK